METTANGPEDESRFYTVRVQGALDACRSGQSVELDAEGRHNAFLIAPLTVPPGVTLLIDAGVTVCGTR